MFNAYSNATDFRHPEPQLQQSIPTDPRARNLIHQVLGKKAQTARWPLLGRARLSRSETLDPLYWLLRWARPARVCMTGCPLDSELLLIAAAIADAGGKRLVVERTGHHDEEVLWPLVASAGLDWLVRFVDSPSAQQCDCRILANSDAVKAFAESVPAGERGEAPLLIGMGDEPSTRSSDDQALAENLNACGFHVIFPPRPDERFWAAVHVERNS